MISLYGVQNQSGKIYFYGPLDQNDLDGTTLTSAQAMECPLERPEQRRRAGNHALFGGSSQ